jgi:uncharacterized protein YlxP (DUF503 family)
MIVGVMTTRLHLHGINSLKEKRSIVKSLISRLKNKFNVSVAEVGHQDAKTSAIVAVAVVANDNRFVNQQLDTIISFMQRDGRFYLGEVKRETF